MHKLQKQKELTYLLLHARAQHTRLTIETLPVGTITIDRDGLIESIDEWTEKSLNFDNRFVTGKDCSMLLGGIDCQDRIEQRQFGYLGRQRLETLTGSIMANLVLAPGLSRHRLEISVIYTHE